MAVAVTNPYPLPLFDEFRTNIQKALAQYDKVIQDIKVSIEASDNLGKIYLYLYQGVFSIIEGEKKYQSGDYSGAYTAYNEGEKMLVRFQRMSTGFPIEYQQQTERLTLFSQGRQNECSALNQGIDFNAQAKNLNETIKVYQNEITLLEKINIPLMIYNAKARLNFAKGLMLSLEGHSLAKSNDFRVAKKKHLDGYRFFVLAAYYNPSYKIWVTEQNNAIMAVMNRIIKDKASKEWNKAYSFTNEGKFLESSESCNRASKLYARASKIALDKKTKMMLKAYSFMFKANMFEAKANDFLKNNNDAKGSIRQYELAAEEMKKAIDSLPKLDDNVDLQNRWTAQWRFYKGNFYQTQGIYNLDSENYPEALNFFTQADTEFNEGMKNAKQTSDSGLKKLITKAIAEAKGYIGMCRTVID